MMVQINQYMHEVHKIKNIIICFGDNLEFDLGEYSTDIEKLVKSFYDMIATLNFQDKFVKDFKTWWT